MKQTLFVCIVGISFVVSGSPVAMALASEDSEFRGASEVPTGFQVQAAAREPNRPERIWIVGGAIGLRYLAQISEDDVRSAPTWNAVGGWSNRDWFVLGESSYYGLNSRSGNLRIEQKHLEWNLWIAKRLIGTPRLWHGYLGVGAGLNRNLVVTTLGSNVDQRISDWFPQWGAEVGARVELETFWLSPFVRVIQEEKNPELEWALGLQVWVAI